MLRSPVPARMRWLVIVGGSALVAWGVWGVMRGTPEAAALVPVQPSAERGDAKVPSAKAVEPDRAPAELVVGARLEPPAEPELVFFGRVVDGRNDAPISGARAFDGHPGRAAVADERGLLELRVPAGRPGAFELRAEGYGLRRFAPTIGSEREEDARTLALLPVATLRVSVRDGGVQALDSYRVRLSVKGYELDVPDQLVHLGSGSLFGSGLRTWEARCSPDGTCALVDLPPRVPFDVELLREREVVLRPTPFDLEPGEVRAVEWRLNEGVRVVGEARDQDGAPVAGCAIRRWGAGDGPTTDVERWILGEASYGSATASTVTDDAGRFSFEDVEPGVWWIGASPYINQRRDIALVALRVEVPRGVSEHFVDLRVDHGLFVRGRVLAPDGSVPQQAWLWATPEGAAGAFFGQMEAGGSFALGPLSAGTYRLIAHSFDVHADSPGVVAHAGDEDVVLQLRTAGTLTGRVVDAREGTTLQAGLRISGLGDLWCRKRTGTSADGSFELRGLAEGSYDLTATTSDGLVGSLRNVSVTRDTMNADLRLELRPGARVEVRYKGAANQCQYEVRSAGALFGDDGLKTGGLAVVPVPPGPIEVLFKLGGQPLETQHAELAIGEERAFVFAPDDE